MKRRICIYYAIILIPLLTNATENFEDLKGKWECKTDEGRIVLEFKTKNLLIYNGEELVYVLVDGTVRVEDDFLGKGSQLIQHFAGTWKNYTKYTETMVVLYPDRTYGQRYTSNYSSAEPSEEWGVAGEEHRQGFWRIQGNLESGIITCTDQSKTETTY